MDKLDFLWLLYLKIPLVVAGICLVVGAALVIYSKIGNGKAG
jgi:hypothetical protein